MLRDSRGAQHLKNKCNCMIQTVFTVINIQNTSINIIPRKLASDKKHKGSSYQFNAITTIKIIILSALLTINWFRKLRTEKGEQRTENSISYTPILIHMTYLIEEVLIGLFIINVLALHLHFGIALKRFINTIHETTPMILWYINIYSFFCYYHIYYWFLRYHFYGFSFGLIL